MVRSMCVMGLETSSLTSKLFDNFICFDGNRKYTSGQVVRGLNFPFKQPFYTATAVTSFVREVQTSMCFHFVWLLMLRRLPRHAKDTECLDALLNSSCFSGGKYVAENKWREQVLTYNKGLLAGCEPVFGRRSKSLAHKGLPLRHIVWHTEICWVTITLLVCFFSATSCQNKTKDVCLCLGGVEYRVGTTGGINTQPHRILLRSRSNPKFGIKMWIFLHSC